MLIPANRAPRNLHSFPDRVVDRLVRHDDIASLGEGRNHTGYSGECLRIDDARRSAQECRDVSLNLHMHVLRAIKPGGAAWTDSISPQCLDCTLFEVLVRVEVVEIVGREIRHGASIR